MNLPLGSLSDPSSIIVAKTNAVTTNSEFSVQQPTYEMHVWSHLKPSNLCISYDYPSHLQHPPAYRVGSRDLERLKISSKTTQLRSDGTTILTGCPFLFATLVLQMPFTIMEGLQEHASGLATTLRAAAWDIITEKSSELR